MGFLYCGICGEELVKHFHNPYERDGIWFECAGEQKNACKADIVTDSKIEKALIEYFSCIETDTEQDVQTLKISKAKAAIINTLHEKIIPLDKDDRTYTDLWLAEKITFEERSVIIRSLKDKKEKLTKAIEQVNRIDYTTCKEEILSMLNADWNEYSNKEKRRFFTNHISKIIVINEPVEDKEQGANKISNIAFKTD
jgi:hypothetical protein